MIELAITVTDQDIAYIRAERKWWAARDQDVTLDKKERKEAQRWVKVCTLVLESIYGTKGGKEGGEPLTRAIQFPLELQDKIEYLYMQATSDHRPYAEMIDQANSHVAYYVAEGWKQDVKWTTTTFECEDLQRH